MAKPPKRYSRAVHRTIVRALEKGNYRTIAFRLAGIHEDTGFGWLKLGRDGPEEYPQFVKLELDMQRAEAAFESRMIEVVMTQAESGEPQTWQAAMTLLERTRPERFGRRDTTVIEGGESPLQVLTHAVITDPELRSGARDVLRRASAARAELTSGPRVGDGAADGDAS